MKNEPTDEELDAVIEEIESFENPEELTDPSTLEQLAEELNDLFWA